MSQLAYICHCLTATEGAEGCDDEDEEKDQEAAAGRAELGSSRDVDSKRMYDKTSRTPGVKSGVAPLPSSFSVVSSRSFGGMTHGTNQQRRTTSSEQVPYEESKVVQRLTRHVVWKRRGFPGGVDLLSYLYDELTRSDDAKIPLLRYLFTAAFQPYLRFMRIWMHSAERLPYNFFAMAESSRTRRLEGDARGRPMSRVVSGFSAVHSSHLVTSIVNAKDGQIASWYNSLAKALLVPNTMTKKVILYHGVNGSRSSARRRGFIAGSASQADDGEGSNDDGVGGGGVTEALKENRWGGSPEFDLASAPVVAPDTLSQPAVLNAKDSLAPPPLPYFLSHLSYMYCVTGLHMRLMNAVRDSIGDLVPRLSHLAGLEAEQLQIIAEMAGEPNPGSSSSSSSFSPFHSSSPPRSSPSLSAPPTTPTLLNAAHVPLPLIYQLRTLDEASNTRSTFLQRRETEVDSVLGLLDRRRVLSYEIRDLEKVAAVEEEMARREAARAKKATKAAEIQLRRVKLLADQRRMMDDQKARRERERENRIAAEQRVLLEAAIADLATATAEVTAALQEDISGFTNGAVSKQQALDLVLAPEIQRIRWRVARVHLGERRRTFWRAVHLEEMADLREKLESPSFSPSVSKVPIPSLPSSAAFSPFRSGMRMSSGILRSDGGEISMNDSFSIRSATSLFPPHPRYGIMVLPDMQGALKQVEKGGDEKGREEKGREEKGKDEKGKDEKEREEKGGKGDEDIVDKEVDLMDIELEIAERDEGKRGKEEDLKGRGVTGAKTMKKEGTKEVNDSIASSSSTPPINNPLSSSASLLLSPSPSPPPPLPPPPPPPPLPRPSSPSKTCLGLLFGRSFSTPWRPSPLRCYPPQRLFVSMRFDVSFPTYRLFAKRSSTCPTSS